MAAMQRELDKVLDQKLREVHDDFQPGESYIRKWKYVTDKSGTVPYRD